MKRATIAVCCLIAVLLAAAPAAAQSTGALTVAVLDSNQAAIANASVTVTPQGGSTQYLTTDDKGFAGCSVPKGAPFTVSVKAAGYASFAFSRTLVEANSFGHATVILCKPRLGNSRVGEWRTGATNAAEDPAKDQARFNFHVKYYKGRLPIAGASIVLTRTDGTTFQTLTADLLGNATVLVPEGTKLDIKVSAPGYADYQSVLQPGMAASSREVNILMKKVL